MRKVSHVTCHIAAAERGLKIKRKWDSTICARNNVRCAASVRHFDGLAQELEALRVCACEGE
jgi:hypothetical protein